MTTSTERPGQTMTSHMVATKVTGRETEVGWMTLLTTTQTKEETTKMKKVTTLILAAAALALQACAIEGSQRFTPTGFQISRTIGIGTGSTYQSNINTGRTTYRRPYQSHNNCYDVPSSHRDSNVVTIGPQYYTMSGSICDSTRIRNYTDAPIVAQTHRGSSVIVPRSWD